MMEQTEDCYGEHLKSADLGELLEALKTVEAREHYWRLPPLIAFLEAVISEKSEWENRFDLQAVHYGY